MRSTVCAKPPVRRVSTSVNDDYSHESSLRKPLFHKCLNVDHADRLRRLTSSAAALFSDRFKMHKPVNLVGTVMPISSCLPLAIDVMTGLAFLASTFAI